MFLDQTNKKLNKLLVAQGRKPIFEEDDRPFTSNPDIDGPREYKIVPDWKPSPQVETPVVVEATPKKKKKAKSAFTSKVVELDKCETKEELVAAIEEELNPPVQEKTKVVAIDVPLSVHERINNFIEKHSNKANTKRKVLMHMLLEGLDRYEV